MAPRKKSSRPKPKRAARPRRPMWRKGARRKASTGFVRSLLGGIPLGPALFAMGIGLGFAIGFGLTTMAPKLMSRLERDISPPVKTAAVEKKAAQPPEIVETTAPVVAVAAPPSAPAPASLPAPAPVSGAAGNTVEPDQSSTVPAAAEESAHQSAAETALPPDDPQQQVVALPSPATKEPDIPAWRQYAMASRDPGDRPMIAIVLDDVGVAPQHAEMAIDLPAPIVLSIMTYAKDAAALARAAHAKGHEIMVHMPMQPMNDTINPGPNALLVGMDAQEIRRRMDWGLDRLSGYIGFNNHMGSRFTQDAAGMRVVLAEAKQRGLLFLDSKTIAGSVGDTLAAQMGVTHIARDVFLDDDMSEAAVARQLARAEAVARKQGYAVAIGHPHPATIAVLKRWLIDARARGFAIVPLTTIVKKREGVAG